MFDLSSAVPIDYDEVSALQVADEDDLLVDRRRSFTGLPLAEMSDDKMRISK